MAHTREDIERLTGQLQHERTVREQKEQMRVARRIKQHPLREQTRQEIEALEGEIAALEEDGKGIASKSSCARSSCRVHALGARLAARSRRRSRRKRARWTRRNLLQSIRTALTAAAFASSRIAAAACRGSAAWVIGRPTTRLLAPALTASAGVSTRFWSPTCEPAGRILGTTSRKSAPHAARIGAISRAEHTTPSMPHSCASFARRTTCSSGAPVWPTAERSTRPCS